MPVHSTTPVGVLLWRSFRHAPACTPNYRAVPVPIRPYDTSLDPPKSGLFSHVLCFTSRSPHTPAVRVVATPTNHAQLSWLHHARP